MLHLVVMSYPFSSVWQRGFLWVFSLKNLFIWLLCHYTHLAWFLPLWPPFQSLLCWSTQSPPSRAKGSNAPRFSPWVWQLFGCVHCLGDFIQPQSFKLSLHLMVPHLSSLNWTSFQSSSLDDPVVYSMSPLGCLIDISNLMCPKVNTCYLP